MKETSNRCLKKTELPAVAFALAACGAFAAVPHHVSTMPDSPWLDTEVFTNVTFNSRGRELRKETRRCADEAFEDVSVDAASTSFAISIR